ncbi:MAG TPA: tetratricopeptide repeat protein [Kofleriaceae bacterium]|nr:tetratricopeptide repeat protein [Kofleriaceae bacterium]
MRIAIVIACVIACAAPLAHGDPDARPAAKEPTKDSRPAKDLKVARAANARGLALQKQKKYAAAEAEYRKAIEADPGFVLAHYNLACAAALAGDHDTALVELAWVGNRAAWDDQARAAAMKETRDPDLKHLGDWEDVARWVPPDVLEVTDVLGPPRPGLAGHVLDAAERTRFAGPLAAAPGAHAAECDPADARQGRVLGLPLILGRVAKQTAVASLRDGVALFDPAGKLIARGEPIGCTAPGASQDMLGSLVYLEGQIATPDNAPQAVPAALYVVQYGAGGRAQWTTNVVIYAQRDKQLVSVFEATLTSSDGAGAGTLVQTVLGDLVLVAPGEKRKRAFHWDPAAFRFQPLP